MKWFTIQLSDFVIVNSAVYLRIPQHSSSVSHFGYGNMSGMMCMSVVNRNWYPVGPANTISIKNPLKSESLRFGNSTLYWSIPTWVTGLWYHVMFVSPRAVRSLKSRLHVPFLVQASRSQFLSVVSPIHAETLTTEGLVDTVIAPLVSVSVLVQEIRGSWSPLYDARKKACMLCWIGSKWCPKLWSSFSHICKNLSPTSLSKK